MSEQSANMEQPSCLEQTILGRTGNGRKKTFYVDIISIVTSDCFIIKFNPKSKTNMKDETFSVFFKKKTDQF